MSHVVHDVQQQYLMRQTRHNMEQDTVYIVFDFKQKFRARGFRESGDAYWGCSGLGWGNMLNMTWIQGNVQLLKIVMGFIQNRKIMRKEVESKVNSAKRSMM